MARAYGSGAALLLKRETAYGTQATGNYVRMPFNRCSLGSEQGLIDDPVLGYGRDPRAPLQDVINDEGDIVVPMDPRYLGFWLTGLFGDPVTTGTGPYVHTFGCTDADLAWKHGRYHMAAGRLRPETYELSCNIDHLVCTAGDLVKVSHAGDFRATLILVDAAPAVHDADTGPIPAFDPQITVPPPVEYERPAKPVIETVDSGTEALTLGSDGQVQSRVLITVTPQVTGLVPAEHIQAQYRRADTDVAWSVAPPAPADARVIAIGPVDDGVVYDIRLRAVSALGRTSDWTSTSDLRTKTRVMELLLWKAPPSADYIVKRKARYGLGRKAVIAPGMVPVECSDPVLRLLGVTRNWIINQSLFGRFGPIADRTCEEIAATGIFRGEVMVEACNRWRTPAGDFYTRSRSTPFESDGTILYAVSLKTIDEAAYRERVARVGGATKLIPLYD